MDSPPAAMDTWKAIADTIAAVPLVGDVTTTEPLSSMLPLCFREPGLNRLFGFVTGKQTGGQRGESKNRGNDHEGD